jgi:hypothetical protein
VGGNTYYPPATFQVLQAGANGACDTLTTFTLVPLSATYFKDTISLCANQTYTFEGIPYTAPAIVSHTYPGQNGGCDTVVSHVLTPVQSAIAIQCPNPVDITLNAGESPTALTFDAPTGTSTCTCPGLTFTQTSGLPSGGTFPVGTTNNCFSATDACGHTGTCCFQVKITELPPCDVKSANCVEWEILSVEQDAAFNKIYRIRVTNNCTNRLQYADFQVPDGIQPVAPPNQSVYTAPSGRNYLVVNPNFSPFYSIRFASQQPGINNGASDIFEYTLPPQTDVAFILAIVRLAPFTWLTAHLNTFKCAGGHHRPEPGKETTTHIFPNPSMGTLMVDIPAGDGELVPIRILDGKGGCALSAQIPAGSGPQSIMLPETLTNGMYFLEVLTSNGTPERLLFVLQR